MKGNQRLWWLVAFALILGFTAGANAAQTTDIHFNATHGYNTLNTSQYCTPLHSTIIENALNLTLEAGSVCTFNNTGYRLTGDYLVNNNAGTIALLWKKNYALSTNLNEWIFGDDGGGYIMFFGKNATYNWLALYDTGGKNIYPSNQIPVGYWETLIFTWNGTGAAVYVNGEYNGTLAVGNINAGWLAANFQFGGLKGNNAQVKRLTAYDTYSDAATVASINLDLFNSGTTINQPTNTTHYNASVPYSFQYQNTYAGMPAGFGENESCGYWLNGALTWLGNQTNGTAITGTLTAPLGHNNFTAFCGNATGGNTTKTVWFTYSNTYAFRAYDAISTNQINSFAINFYNTTNTTTYNTATGWLNVSRSGLPTGNVTLEIMASGYRTTNYTRDVNESTVIYENYPLSFAGVNITMYDESTAVPIYATVSIYNATNTLTWGNVLNVTQALNASIPSGAVTVDVSTANSSYYARRYYGTLNNNTFYELKAYLLNTSGSTVYVRFHIRDLVGQPIQNATVQILRAIGGGASVVVGEMETDSSGDAAFYMELGAPYQLQIVAAGYLDYYSTLNPSSNDYTITLTTTTGGSYGLPVNVFEDITYYIIPSTALYNEITNLTLTIYSSNSSLDYFGAAFYNSTGYQLYFVNATGSPNGGVIYYNHNHTNNTGNITMQFWFRRNPIFTGNYTWPWLGGFFNNTAYSLNYTLGQMKTSGASNIGMGILWLLISLIMGAFVCRVNLFGGAIATIATLAVGSYAGWMTFPAIGGGSTIAATALIAALAFAVFGLLYLRDRI
jgi:hypothetical protein